MAAKTEGWKKDGGRLGLGEKLTEKSPLEGKFRELQSVSSSRTTAVPCSSRYSHLSVSLSSSTIYNSGWP